MRTVAAIYTSPVKSFALESRDSVQVGFSGIAEDRRFHLINDEGRLLTQRQLGTMATISASYDVETGVLKLSFPDSTFLEGPVEPAKRLRTDVFGRWVTGAVAAGDWNGALSEFFGTGVRLVRSEGACEVFDEYPISLLSQASVDLLGSRAGELGEFRRPEVPSQFPDRRLLSPRRGLLAGRRHSNRTGTPVANGCPGPPMRHHDVRPGYRPKGLRYSPVVALLPAGRPRSALRSLRRRGIDRSRIGGRPSGNCRAVGAPVTANLAQ